MKKKIIVQPITWRGQLYLRDGKVISFNQNIALLPKKIPGLALLLFKSMQRDRKISVTIFKSAKLSDADTVTEKGQFGLDQIRKNMMKVQAYFKQEIQTNNLL